MATLRDLVRPAGRDMLAWDPHDESELAQATRRAAAARVQEHRSQSGEVLVQRPGEGPKRTVTFDPAEEAEYILLPRVVGG